MDLTPSFGPHELLETLSQRSGNSDPRTAGSASGSGSSQREKSSSSTSNEHERAKYRQVGEELSKRAHGDLGDAQVQELTLSINSCFQPFQPDELELADQGSAFRTQKVAKMRYSDHGQHQQQIEHVSILKKTTIRAKELFHLCAANTEAWRHNEMNIEQETAEESVKQQERALSNLDLEKESEDKVGRLRWTHRDNIFEAQSKGLLSAVLEGHSDSQTSGGPNDRSTSIASQSISTKDSKTISTFGTGAAGSAAASHTTPASPTQPRGSCLTQPSEPTSNNSCDNSEGDLIIYENDIIVVPRKSVHRVGEQADIRPARSAEFKVQGLLGQGTFAQVFRCLHMQTGQVVAVKVVKNRPAYTRQAAVEIDVFRALQEEEQKSEGSSGDSNPSPPSTSHRDRILNLYCYFMHRSHLCIVFEVLGANLYEVLKKRQFRGLPLSNVQAIMKQSLQGIKEISKKNIVHCDLKPENILMVSDTVADSIISGNGRDKTDSETDSSAMTPCITEASGSASGGSGTNISGGSKSTNSTMPATNVAPSSSNQKIKLIDFGSACFEGYTAHPYIQSRFYRSPEVLVGLPYDSAIDIWSLGCIAAELFLGLPILPGEHEHDQLSRITEMISKVPEWMLEQGSKASQYFVKFVAPRTAQHERISHGSTPRQTPPPQERSSPLPSPLLPQWRMKSQEEYVRSLSASELSKKGGVAKLEKKPGNRYFKRRRLVDIVVLHSQKAQIEKKELLPSFVHFLYGVLDPDPWKRWTVFQALQHPFITGDLSKMKSAPPNDMDAKSANHANLVLDLYWEPPWDPSICKRKLLNVQKLRDKQQALRRSLSGRDSAERRRPRWEQGSGRMEGSTPGTSGTSETNPWGRTAESPPVSLSTGSASVVVSSASTSSASQPTFTIMQPATMSVDQMQLDRAFTGSQQHSGGSVTYGGHMEMHSYSGAVGAGSAMEVDFAYALQRPGVIPGRGKDASVSSRSSYQLPNYDQPGLIHQSPHMVQSSSQSIEGDVGRGYNSLSVVGNVPRPMNESGSYDSSLNYNVPYQMDASVAPSLGSSVTMSEAPPIYHQQYPTFQHQHVIQQQMTAMAPQQVPYNQGIQPQPFNAPGQQHFNPSGQHQQQFSTPGQQQQFHAPGQQQQHFNPPGQQQPFNAPVPQPFHPPGHPQFIQQQQVYMTQTGAPGGGYYYVTTAANGQPIILQPVGMLNPNPVDPYAAPPETTQQHFHPPPDNRRSRNQPYRGGTSM